MWMYNEICGNKSKLFIAQTKMSSSEPHEDDVSLLESIEHVPNVPHSSTSNIRKQNANNVTRK